MKGRLGHIFVFDAMPAFTDEVYCLLLDRAPAERREKT
jgi:hypothetical protein